MDIKIYHTDQISHTRTDDDAFKPYIICPHCNHTGMVFTTKDIHNYKFIYHKTYDIDPKTSKFNLYDICELAYFYQHIKDQKIRSETDLISFLSNFFDNPDNIQQEIIQNKLRKLLN